MASKYAAQLTWSGGEQPKRASVVASEASLDDLTKAGRVATGSANLAGRRVDSLMGNLIEFDRALPRQLQSGNRLRLHPTGPYFA